MTLLLAPAGVVLLFAITTVPSINVVGPVHYAELIAPLVLVSASGIEELAQWVRTRLDASPGRVLALPIAATCARSSCISRSTSDRSARWRAWHGRPYDLVEPARLDHAVVFVQSLGALDFPPGSWAYYPRNPSPGLTDPVLYVRDLGERNRELVRLMPDRQPFWMGDARTANSYWFR